MSKINEKDLVVGGIYLTDPNDEVCEWDGEDFNPLSSYDAFRRGVLRGLEDAIEIADTYANEEVEKEARTRFVWGQVLGARKVRAEIQALLDKLLASEVSNG